MLLRFTTLSADPDSGHRAGVLVAAHELRDEGDLTVDEHTELRLMLSWFNEHLFVPSLLNDHEHRRAISWFRENAHEPIQKMWSLKRLLETHGVHTEILRTREPGTIVYEDKYQVIAKPPKGVRF